MHKLYESDPCPRCGDTARYFVENRCRGCMRARNKRYRDSRTKGPRAPFLACQEGLAAKPPVQLRLVFPPRKRERGFVPPEEAERKRAAQREAQRKWRKAHPEYHKEYGRRYRATQKGKARNAAKHAARRARKRAAACDCCRPGDIRALYAFASALGLEIDHITPLAAGGLHCLTNLQPLTRKDHEAKTLQDIADLQKTRSVKELPTATH